MSLADLKISTKVVLVIALLGIVAGSIAGIGSYTNEISRNIEGVAQAAQQTGAASEMVLTAANSLAEEAEKLRKEVDTFLAALNAA